MPKRAGNAKVTIHGIHPLLRTGGLLRSARYCILCLCDIRKEFDSTGFQEHAVQFYMMEGDLESRYHKQKTNPFTPESSLRIRIGEIYELIKCFSFCKLSLYIGSQTAHKVNKFSDRVRVTGVTRRRTN